MARHFALCETENSVNTEANRGPAVVKKQSSIVTSYFHDIVGSRVGFGQRPPSTALADCHHLTFKGWRFRFRVGGPGNQNIGLWVIHQSIARANVFIWTSQNLLELARRAAHGNSLLRVEYPVVRSPWDESELRLDGLVRDRCQFLRRRPC